MVDCSIQILIPPSLQSNCALFFASATNGQTSRTEVNGQLLQTIILYVPISNTVYNTVGKCAGYACNNLRYKKKIFFQVITTARFKTHSLGASRSTGSHEKWRLKRYLDYGLVFLADTIYYDVKRKVFARSDHDLWSSLYRKIQFQISAFRQWSPVHRRSDCQGLHIS